MVVERHVYWGTAKYKDWIFYLAATDLGLGLITWPDDSFEDVVNWVKRRLPGCELVHEPSKIESYRNALIQYFKNGYTDLDTISFDFYGTDFQIDVWNALRVIPSGRTKTYSEIAAMIGRPDAVRAVAHAIGSNPIAFLIPCHRVIGKDGNLTGYRGGLRLKEALLQLEGIWPKEPEYSI
jgi:methylated-DNA-[protein]-cysteine S-methyltransferase